MLTCIKGAEFSNSSEAVIYSCESAMNTSSGSWDTCLLLTFLVSDEMVHETDSEVVAVIAWCSKVLASGTFPPADCESNLSGDSATDFGSDNI